MPLTESEELELLELEEEELQNALPVATKGKGEESSIPEEMVEPKPFFSKNIDKKVFPSLSQEPMPKDYKPSVGETIKGAAGMGLDLLSLPVRALGTLRTNPETGEKYKLNDNKSAVLRPEVNKTKGAISNATQFDANDNYPTRIAKGAAETLGRGVTEIAGGIASDPTAIISLAGKTAGKALTAVGKKGNELLGKLTQELSGVSEETLRKVGSGLGKGAKELKDAAGTQKQIGDKLLDALDNFDDYLPEKKIVSDALQNMPPVNVNNTINTLSQAKATGMLSGTKKINSEIDELITDIAAAADDQGNMPAAQFSELRKEIDKVIGDNFGKSTNDYLLAAKKARYQMADDLIKTAESSGNAEYVTAMKSFSDKLKLSDELKGYIGKSAQVRDRRVESFIGTLFGKNKGDRQNVIESLGKVFGEDFLKDSKLASMAAELGTEGVAGVLPRQFTGRSTLGAGLTIGGAAAGFGPASAIPLALSSPRIAAGALAGATAAGKGLSATGSAALKASSAIKGLPGAASVINNEIERQLEEKKRKATK